MQSYPEKIKILGHGDHGLLSEVAQRFESASPTVFALSREEQAKIKELRRVREHESLEKCKIGGPINKLFSK
ncbi:MAG: hypothetical protein AB1921_15855 [Thermodesulfobacteriota bacterium]